ncbi:histone H2A.Z-specific chaperone CHZ1-like [Trichogramma pretiosum]|uniref:histone H2A.Z-specific chaperone CHZ1-like n=1 Tax=Trichogramma pretiosum TaxID=7493 RepID=UPI000C718995|nr:histone H2A.Z-specific chaperone CHZ1-like [Trichogramma pretiosum]
MSEVVEKYEDGEEDSYEEGDEFEGEDLDAILDAEQQKPTVPDDFEGVESYDGEHLYDYDDDDDDHRDDADSKRDAAVDTNETDKKQSGDPDSKTLRSVKSRKGRGGKKDDDSTQQQKIKANEYVEYEEDVERAHDAGGADDKPGFMELIAKLQDVLRR